MLSTRERDFFSANDDERAANSIIRRVERWLLLAAVALLSPAFSQAQQTFTCPQGFGPPADPPPQLTSLKTVANPVLPGGLVPEELQGYIQNKDAAIRLGKALFWDVQASSDNKVACATCHYHAGADERLRNQLHPGPNQAFDFHGANGLLTPGDYPFTRPPTQVAPDDTAGSQGIRKSQFLGLTATGEELTASIDDPVFNAGGLNVRQVTDMQSPSTINAVFNHRQFWDGRAQDVFNGVNPFGERDAAALAWVAGTAGIPLRIAVRIPNASLASQAVGPPVNTSEMAAIGRTFPDLGRKLLRRKPLGLQAVAPTDSVLGPLADTISGKGLSTSYAALIQQAFQPRWWNASANVDIGGQPYAMMEANFSLYWGLAVMLYQSTLVSDDTPIDRYLDSGRTNPAVLDDVVARFNAEGVRITRTNILNGLALFETPLEAGGAGCIECHGGPELTLASVAEVTGLRPENPDEQQGDFDFRMERMFMNLPPVPTNTVSVTYNPANYTMSATLATGATAPVPIAVYDAGFYDIGIRPTLEHLGLGGLDPFGKPLSFTRLLKQSPLPGFFNIPGERLACGGTGQVVLSLAGPLLATEADDIDASFKTPGLRNVELNGPYLHNGGKSTLAQVMELYDEGGDFPLNPNLAPLIVPLQLSNQDMIDMISFMVALTDERVRWQRAPFDHPQLDVPVGQNPDGSDVIELLPAVGAAGADAPLIRFMNLNPFDGVLDPVPIITVTEPAAGASWQRGSTQTIRWTSAQVSGNVKIFVSVDNGPWTNIAWDIPNSGAFPWPIRVGPSSNVRVRVTSMASNAVFGESGVFAITPPATAPSIAVIAPATGTSWPMGSPQTIQWTSANLTGNVKIFVTLNGGPWTSIAWDIPNTGSFAWTVNHGPSLTARIRVTSMANNAVFAESPRFTITPPPSAPAITVSVPAAGANWPKGSLQTVQWFTQNLTGNVKIFVSLNGGPWTAIAWDIPNTGAFPWTIKLGPSANCRIRVTSMANNSIFGESGLFTINP